MDNVKVRYNNSLNRIENGALGSVEQNLFFYICSRIREKEEEMISISFDSIRDRTGFTAHGDKALVSALRSVNKNLLMLNYEYIAENGTIIQGGIFSTFVIDPHKRTLSVRMNSDLLFLLNGLEGNFSEWELDEFTKIKSSYTKRMYRLCKEWRTIGKTPVYNINEFKNAIGLPQNYENKKLVSRILTNAEDDLKKYFKNFKIVLHYGAGRGNPMIGVSFKFAPTIYLSCV